MSEQYYIRLKGQVQGPFAIEELHDLAKRARFSRMHQVSTDGVHWERATKHPDLFPKPTLPAPQAQLATADLNLAEPVDAPQATIPGDAIPENLTSPEAMWYYTRDAEEAGPVVMADLKQLLEAGQLSATDMLWTDGMTDWVEAGAVAELFPLPEIDAASFAAGSAEKSNLATASLVLSILGFFCLPFFGHLGGVICGHLARNQIRASGNALGGRGYALTGLILGYFGLAMLLLVIVVAIVVMLLRSS